MINEICLKICINKLNSYKNSKYSCSCSNLLVIFYVNITVSVSCLGDTWHDLFSLSLLPLQKAGMIQYGDGASLWRIGCSCWSGWSSSTLTFLKHRLRKRDWRCLKLRNLNLYCLHQHWLQIHQCYALWLYVEILKKLQK